MAFKADTYRIFIASPSDLTEERIAVTRAVHEWNDKHAEAEKVVLLPLKWETHLLPQFCDRPQQAINDDPLSQCDMLVGLFGTKLGTPTGVAKSGTVEEIDSVAQAGKPCLLYFSDRMLKPSEIDLQQLANLRDFKASTYQRAVVGKFCTIDELTNKFSHDLLQVIRKQRSCAKISKKTEHPFEVRVSTGHQVPVCSSSSTSSRPAIRIGQLHHMSLAVKSVKDSIQFYRDLLGLNEIPRAPFDFDGAWFRLPNGQELHLVERDDSQDAPHYRQNHFAFRVTDFDAAADWLNERCSIKRYLTLPTGFPQLYVCDPDGNVVEINSCQTVKCQKARRNAIKLRN